MRPACASASVRLQQAARCGIDECRDSVALQLGQRRGEVFGHFIRGQRRDDAAHDVHRRLLQHAGRAPRRVPLDAAVRRVRRCRPRRRTSRERLRVRPAPCAASCSSGRRAGRARPHRASRASADRSAGKPLHPSPCRRSTPCADVPRQITRMRSKHLPRGSLQSAEVERRAGIRHASQDARANPGNPAAASGRCRSTTRVFPPTNCRASSSVPTIDDAVLARSPPQQRSAGRHRRCRRRRSARRYRPGWACTVRGGCAAADDSDDATRAAGSHIQPPTESLMIVRRRCDSAAPGRHGSYRSVSVSIPAGEASVRQEKSPGLLGTGAGVGGLWSKGRGKVRQGNRCAAPLSAALPTAGP